MLTEMRALHKNETWEVVELPYGEKKQWDVNKFSPSNINQMAP